MSGAKLRATRKRATPEQMHAGREISLTLRIQNPECGRPCACVPRAGSGGPSHDCRASPPGFARVGNVAGPPVGALTGAVGLPPRSKPGLLPARFRQQRVEPLRRLVAQIISREPSLSPRRAVTCDNAQAGSPRRVSLPTGPDARAGARRSARHRDARCAPLIRPGGRSLTRSVRRRSGGGLRVRSGRGGTVQFRPAARPSIRIFGRWAAPCPPSNRPRCCSSPPRGRARCRAG